MRNRWYDPDLARFLSEDPIGLAGGINPYVYADNDPVNRRDPWGLQGCPDRACQAIEIEGITVYGRERKEPYRGSRGRVDRRVDLWGMGMGGGGGSTALSVAAGSLPVLSTAYDASAALTGYDFLTGEAVGLEGRILAVVGMATPLSGAHLRALTLADRFLGPRARVITNRFGDKVFLSRDGLRRLRFDINHPHPHASPHGHIEEFAGGRWRKSGPIYPTNVTR